jgi:hypothetical protein
LAFHSSQIIISNILIHKCLIASPNLCAKWIFGIILRQINICDQSAPIKNVRQILFESLFCAEDLSEIHPQIHPGKNVQADENIEIFVAPSASRVCMQHLLVI